MTNLFLIAAGALLASTGTPSIARDAAPVAATTTDAAVANGAPAATHRAAQRYCVEGTLTGSRIQRKECHTRAEWQAQGFDPLATK